jgi:hypothetical protein
MDELKRQNRNDAEHASEFDRKIYTAWKQQTKSAGSEHFGNSEPRWVTISCTSTLSRSISLSIPSPEGDGSKVNGLSRLSF